MRGRVTRIARRVAGSLAILGLATVLLTPGAMDRHTVTVLEGALIMLVGVTLFGMGAYWAGWTR